MTWKPKPPAEQRPRRAKGTGSVSRYQTEAGPRWRYGIVVPVDPAHPEAGTGHRSRGGFGSYQEANDQLTLLRADLIRNVPQVIGRDCFGPYAQRWLDGHSCANGTRVYIQRVIDAMHPYIGAVRLTDIRATDLAAAYRGLERGTQQAPSPKRYHRKVESSPPPANLVPGTPSDGETAKHPDVWRHRRAPGRRAGPVLVCGNDRGPGASAAQLPRSGPLKVVERVHRRRVASRQMLATRHPATLGS